ncbi:MAG TPA: penicillin acylase family protein [Streptosporangiaceae bacterium]|nr:penicillin acylase family protein [Streptosporangiaceae bacterium]
MSVGGTRRSGRVAALLAGSRTANRARAAGWRLVAAGVAVGIAASLPVGVGPAAASAGTGGGAASYQATIVRTAYGVPHITARSFGSLGYGYGFALASDDLCTMAQTYVTVEGERSRYFGPDATVAGLAGGQASNLDSDIYWRSVIGSRLIPRLLAVRTGPGAILPQVRQVMAGYAAGYNRYLASVGGSKGVPDPTCRGNAWVKPITTLDAYLLVYQIVDLEGPAANPWEVAEAQPPAGVPQSAVPQSAVSSGAVSSSAPAALSALAASAVRTAPGTGGLPTVSQLSKLGQQAAGSPGSNAIAIGSAGARDHQHGLLLGNPHLPWQGALRLYQVQFTIPGAVNVEGATLLGIPLVVIGFTNSMAWSETTTRSWTATPYQLTLVPGHPTEYVYNGRPVAMTSQTVTVPALTASGAIAAVRHTVWSTRYGPVIAGYHGPPFPWTTATAFALADANAGNLRILNHFLATDQAQSAAAELSILKKYQGLPWTNTTVTDATGHALYADVLTVPHVTNAQAARCDTALGQVSFAQSDLPILDGSRPSCALGTDPDSAVPGIFGGNEEPVLMRRDFVENSNDSYWLANPRHPLSGYPQIFGDTGARWGAEPIDQEYDLRARSALTMVLGRIDGTDGLGPAGFTFAGLKNLMYSDVQYGATLVKPALVAMCRSLPGGLAPTSSGGTIPVGDSCGVLAAWNERENPGSRGAVLFADFWGEALSLPGGPWSHPFQASDPVHTPYGLDTASLAVRQAFGDALAQMTAAGQPYGIALGQVQYVTLDGQNIPLPGGPADPNGELNAMYINSPGAVPALGSTYIQVVTWASGDRCPEAATVLTYSESDNPASPHYADQTKLFSRRQWATAYFCPAQVAAHAVSVTVVSGR